MATSGKDITVNYVLLLSALWRCIQWRQEWSQCSSVTSNFELPWEISKLWKSDGMVHCLVLNAAVLSKKYRERIIKFWTIPSDDVRKKKEKYELVVWQLSDSVLLRWFFAPLGVLLVMISTQLHATATQIVAKPCVAAPSLQKPMIRFITT